MDVLTCADPGGAKGIRTPDLLDANESNWTFTGSSCVGCVKSSQVSVLVRLAAESRRKFCCSPSVPPLLPQQEASKHASPGLLADVRMASPLVRPSAGYLILAGIAVGGHSQLVEGGPQLARREPAVTIATQGDVFEHFQGEAPVASRRS